MGGGTNDLLDRGEPRVKAWEEFRARYSAGLLLHSLFQDLDSVYPDYAEDLWSRLNTAYDYEDILQKEGEYDGWLPIHGPGGIDSPDVWWIKKSDLDELYDSLFPHGIEAHRTNFTSLSTVVILFHSAIELYANTIGIPTRRGLIVSIIKAFPESSLPSDLIDTLRELDATRHVVVHNGGIVDEPYIRAVSGTRFQIGEYRSLSVKEVERFADATLKIGRMFRDSYAS